MSYNANRLCHQLTLWSALTLWGVTIQGPHVTQCFGAGPIAFLIQLLAVLHNPERITVFSYIVGHVSTRRETQEVVQAVDKNF